MTQAASAHQPRVLVLMATYQGAPWVAEQVKSVLEQVNVDVKIVVSDDGSSDGTREILEHIARNEPRLLMLPYSTPSGSAAANFRRLIIQASAEEFSYIALSDQDDVWQPTKLVTACQTLVRCDAQLYSSAVFALWPDGRQSVVVQSTSETPADFLFEGAGQGCTFVLSKPLFQTIRLFLARCTSETAFPYYHDWLIYALARCRAHRWVYDSQPRMIYRQHAFNDTGAQSSTSGIARRLRLIRSGWYRDQVVAVTTLCLVEDPALPIARRIQALMASSQLSISGRLRWSAFALMQSRRRWRDRFILFGAALVGDL